MVLANSWHINIVVVCVDKVREKHVSVIYGLCHFVPCNFDVACECQN